MPKRIHTTATLAVHDFDPGGPTAVRRFLVILGVLIALAIGAAIGTGNILLALFVALCGGFVSYGLIVRHITWQVALLLCFLDFSFEPAGFRFGALELSCFLGFGLFATQIWQKRIDTVHPFFRTNAFLFFRTALFLWLVYAVARFVWNYLKPFNPSEFALNNAIKSEFSVTAIILLMWLFSFRPRDITVKRGFCSVIAVLLLVGLGINIAIRLYGIKQGIFAEDSTEGIDSALFVPFLNMSESPYSLRFLGPTSVLYAMVFLTSPRSRSTTTWRTGLVYYGLLFGGLFGAAISGGRADVLLAVGLCILVAAARRKFAALACLGIPAIIGFCLLNVFSQKIVSDPSLAMVQRSLYWAMMDQAHWAGESINSSTLWRQELFYRAIDEWKSTPMIFCFGRGTYKFTDEDLVAIERDHWEGALEASLRRGATHNLVSDLLITYGLVGLIFYSLICIALIRLSFRFATDRKLPKDATDLGVICAVTVVLTVVYGVVAGNFLSACQGWFVVVILARIAQSAFESTKGTEKAAEF